MENKQLSVEFTARDLRKLVVPLVVEQLLAITVGLSDSLMVAQVGEAAMSAVSLVDTVNVLLVNAFAALATGGAVIAGQYLGRREPDKAGHSGQQLLLFMGEVSLLITVLFYLGKGFILGVVFGQVEPDVAAYANTYFMIVEASTPFLAIYSAGAALFRVMGNSGISMWVSLTMNAINVVGNAILIFAVGMEVEGVAYPTLVSRIFAAVAMVVLLLKRPNLPLRVEHFTFRHDRYVVKNILRFGVPNGLENSMFQLGKILLLSTVSVLGTASVAANAIGNTIASFQCVAGTALGLAIVTVVSRCILPLHDADHRGAVAADAPDHAALQRLPRGSGLRGEDHLDARGLRHCHLACGLHPAPGPSGGGGHPLYPHRLHGVHVDAAGGPGRFDGPFLGLRRAGHLDGHVL